MNHFHNESKFPSASVVSAFFSTIFVTSVTILAELVPSFKNWLASTFYHHWIGKGVLTTGIFVTFFVFMVIFGKGLDDERLAGQIKLLNVTLALGTFVIFFFTVYETFK